MRRGPAPRTPSFTAADLFRGRTAAAWRADYAGAYDWGPDIGREAMPNWLQSGKSPCPPNVVPNTNPD